MTNIVRRIMPMPVRVAASIMLVAALVACGSSDSDSSKKEGANGASASAMPTSSAPAAYDVKRAVYPELGYVDYVDEAVDGSKACNNDVVSASLTLNGTVTINGTPVSTSLNDSGVVIGVYGRFDGLALVINGAKAAAVPAEARNAKTALLTLDTEDWGTINKITVCATGGL